MDVITVGPGLAARSFPGDGRPVLLVHGLSSNARLWDAVARRELYTRVDCPALLLVAGDPEEVAALIGRLT